jgi:hypothetical protein
MSEYTDGFGVERPDLFSKAGTSLVPRASSALAQVAKPAKKMGLGRKLAIGAGIGAGTGAGVGAVQGYRSGTRKARLAGQ